MLDFEDILGEYHHGRKKRQRAGQSREALAHRRQAERIARYYAVHHTHPGPNLPGELKGTHFPRKVRLFDTPIEGWERDDEDAELGIAPLLAAALPAVASIAGPAISGLFGGGGGGDKPAPAPAPSAPAILPVGGGSSGVDAEALRGIVRELLSTVAPPIRQQVTDAIRDQLQNIKAGSADLSKLLGDIVKQIGPQLNAQLDSVNKAALQRQATFEHEALKRQEQRWRANAEAQRRMFARMNDVEAKLGTAIMSAGAGAKRLAAAYGAPKTYT